jgi:hypothetical protein
MSIIKRTSFLAALLLTSILSFSQYTMNSPYSRFGVGDLEPGGFAINKSMGGIGIAIREPNQINYLNPASYTTQDSMSFIWDIGMKGNISNYSTTVASMKQRNYNFDHLALSLPINKWYFASAGMIPYSKTGYDYFETDSFPDGEKSMSRFVGTGNLNRFYFGNGFSILNKKFNVGFNISYLFGSITNSSLLGMIDSRGSLTGIQTNKYYNAGLTGWLFSIGAQGTFQLSDQLFLTTGLVYEPQASLDAEIINRITRYDTMLFNAPDTGKYIIPGKFGAGVALKFKDNLTVGLDYTLQDWSKASFMGKNNDLNSSNRLSLGMQYVPDKESFRSYFAKIRYRAGFFYEDTYLQIQNTGIKDYGFSVGLGLPFRRTNTMFNLCFEMGKRGTTTNNLIEDSYMKLAVSVSLYDFWFYKRKYD